MRRVKITSGKESFIGPFNGDNNNNENEIPERSPYSTSSVNLLTSKRSDDLTLKYKSSPFSSSASSRPSKTGTTPRNAGDAKKNIKMIPQSNKEKRWSSSDIRNFDFTHMESTLPNVDWEVLEANIRAASKEEKRRRNDREEIRKRLAMGIDSESSLDFDKAFRKPSLQSRLQNGTNLQICFMNETASDGSDTENQREAFENCQLEDTFHAMAGTKMPASLPPLSISEHKTQQPPVALDFFSQQAKLQQEARAALAQAKELARIQMQVERQQRKHTRMSDLVRQSLEKLGIPFPWDCRRLSRQILTELNIAQLQVIVNDLHTQIEGLNEELVQLLLKRDDCHMEQDSMLVDIEDLTRYLTAKQMALEAGKWNDGPISLPARSECSASAIRSNMRPVNLMDARK